MTYMTRDQAYNVAETNEENAYFDGDDWTYKVESRGKWYVVAVRDGDGNLLGYL